MYYKYTIYARNGKLAYCCFCIIYIYEDIYWRMNQKHSKEGHIAYS